jgi:hypothetical protein
MSLKDTCILICTFLALGGVYFFAEQPQQKVPTVAVQPAILRVAASDPAGALLLFRERLSASPKGLDSCHGFAHKIGHEAFAHLGLERALSVQDPLCVYGYLHGVLEAAYGDAAVAYTPEDIFAVCKNKGRCYHGMGHALMVQKGTLPESLAFFARFASEHARANCADGVFMHFFDTEDTGIPKVDPRDIVQNIAEFCTAQPSQFRKNCALYAPRIYNTELEQSFAACTQFSSVDLKKFCVMGAGIAYTKYNLSAPLSFRPFCEDSHIVDVTFPDMCLIGSERYLYYQGESTGDTVDAKE